MWKYLSLAVIISILLTYPVWGLDVVQVPTKSLRVTWVEPSTNVDGTPLDDLAKIILRGSVGGVDFLEVEAGISGPTGGQAGSFTFQDICQPNTKPTVILNVYAVDTSGNESEPTTMQKVVDCLPPGKVK